MELGPRGTARRGWRGGRATAHVVFLGDHERGLTEIAAGRVDIIIGTPQRWWQGPQFPRLIWSAGSMRSGLAHGCDRGAAEALQLLNQVIGRGALSRAAASAICRTNQHGHPVMKAMLGACDSEAFFASEACRQTRMSRALSAIRKGGGAEIIRTPIAPTRQFLRRVCGIFVADRRASRCWGPGKPTASGITGPLSSALLGKAAPAAVVVPCRNIARVARGEGPKTKGNLKARWICRSQ